MNTPPRLVADPADVATQKVLVAARAASVELQLAPAGAAPAVPELHMGGRVIRHTNAVLRCVGRIYEDSDIYGTSFIEVAQVDSWLDWAELELGRAKPSRVQEALAVLEKQLDGNKYLVGQRLTLADISLACSLYHFERQGVAELPRATKEWLGRCVAQESFKAVLEDSAAAAPPSTAATTASAAAAAGPASDDQLVADYSSCVGGRTQIRALLLGSDGGKSLVGRRVTVCGWVKTMREASKGQLVFVELNDGSCCSSLQCVIDAAADGFSTLKGRCNTGASMKCTGSLVASPGGKQSIELLVKEGDEVALFGAVDAKDYPISKKHHGLEFLRSVAHLRPRSNLIGCVARVRAALCQATHEFFRSRGFLYVHTPLITAADCEGAGEMFQVTTLLADAEKNGLPMAGGKIDYTQDFFGKPAFMTVSGQLAVEPFCCSLSNAYTFGPTFRAENSHTSRHLAEFWMIEPELAFADLFDNMDCAEDYLKFCVQYALDHNLEDLQFFDSNVEKGLVKRLEDLLAEPFARVTYTEGVEILIKESPKAKFQVPVEWGMDLGSEHERYLCEKVFMKPIILYNYPKEIKAFYMRLNDDEKTVGAMDLLVPAIGEVIGGSAREERLDVLDRRMKETDLDPKEYWWYRDLRRFGSVPHCGFGLGLERLVMLTTGVENIRDVIPYPRYPGHADF